MTPEEYYSEVLDDTSHIRQTVGGINAGVGQTNTKLDSIININNNILGSIPDIRRKVTDIRIERIYIGDREEKRKISEEQITKLLAQGYRPYMYLGLSEDLSRYAFAKYTGLNAPLD